MTDPVTIGTLAASALAMAGDETIKGFVGEAVKDAYKKLKDKIAHWAGGDVAKAVDSQPPEEQALVKALVAELVAALKNEAKKSEGGGPVGLDISNLDALEVDIGAITVTEGTGVRMKQVKTTGAFKVGPTNVGPPPGKTDR